MEDHPIKKWIVIVVTIGATILIGFALASPYLSQQARFRYYTELAKYSVRTQAVASSTIPGAMPTDLPFDAAATLTQNKTVTAPSGETQSIRIYTTAKSLDDSYLAFKTYLTAHSWTISQSSETATLGFLFAKDTKGNTLVIVIKPMPQGETVVSVTYNTPPAK